MVQSNLCNQYKKRNYRKLNAKGHQVQLNLAKDML